ncbi:MAG: hypothetical protein PHN32_03010 [Actinomycetota bacterium]|jgi:Tfp pilus assembly protein PilN|nr:hypothetical protein [Actinomycetota bacterium]
MKYIDLLPRQERIFNKRTVALNIAIILIVIILAAMSFGLIILKDMNQNLNQDLAQYQAKGKELQGYVEQLKAYEQFQQRVQTKEDLIGSLQQKEILWSKLIHSLGESVPPRISLTNFEGSMNSINSFLEGYSEEKMEQKVSCFTVKGYAENYTDVSRLIISLKQIPYIGDAWVEGISNSQITEGVNGLIFTVQTFWDIPRLVEEWEITAQTENDLSSEADQEQFLELE